MLSMAASPARIPVEPSGKKRTLRNRRMSVARSSMARTRAGSSPAPGIAAALLLVPKSMPTALTAKSYSAAPSVFGRYNCPHGSLYEQDRLAPARREGQARSPLDRAPLAGAGRDGPGSQAEVAEGRGALCGGAPALRDASRRRDRGDRRAQDRPGKGMGLFPVRGGREGLS